MERFLYKRETNSQIPEYRNKKYVPSKQLFTQFINNQQVQQYNSDMKDSINL